MKVGPARARARWPGRILVLKFSSIFGGDAALPVVACPHALPSRLGPPQTTRARPKGGRSKCNFRHAGPNHHPRGSGCGERMQRRCALCAVTRSRSLSARCMSCARATRSPPLTPRGRIVSQAQRRSRTARSSSFTHCSTATSHRTSWRARSEHMRIEATKTRRVKALDLEMLLTVSSDDVR